ncbi:MAG: phosphoribosyltransferase family protein [Nitrospirota bacterium]
MGTAGELIEDALLRGRLRVFRDRSDAGQRLAAALAEDIKGNEIVMAIPSGGVPVAFEIAKAFSLPLDLLIVRKVQIPWNAEAGFGAVDPDGNKIFNEKLLGQLGLSEKDVNAQVEKTMATIRQRNRVFRPDMPAPELTERGVIIVDDGLASGYTMLSAVGFAKKRKARKVVVAVPTALDRTVDLILPEVDRLFCLNIRSGFSFAVADAYRDWYDLTDEEVLSIIGKYPEKRRKR